MPNPHPDIALTVRGSPGVELTLTHYHAGKSQDRHAHDHTQVSFLLAGSLQETIGRRCNEVTTSAACIKLAGVDHQNLWGRCGALMLSVRLARVATELLPHSALATWQPTTRPPPSLVREFLAPGGDTDVDGLADDLISLIDADSREAAAPPAWLARVREALWDVDGLSAAEAARIAGVHRVHMSRAFSRHVGIPFSVYRRRVMTARAIESTLRSGSPLAEVAQLAGFADQSHMNRAIVDITGMSPRLLCNRFRRAA